MLRKITLLAMMLVLAFGTAAIAGCGGDDGNSGGSSTTESTDSGGSSGGGGGGNVSDNPQVKAAVEQCKTAVDAQPTLKASTKKDLEDICEKAGSGDIKDAQKAAAEVCQKIVDDTVPSGPAHDQALSACKSATP